MMTFSPEVQKLVSACEKVQFLIAQGKTLTSDERDIVLSVLTDLVTKLISPSTSPGLKSPRTF